jgi:arylamine N-acetyltransferase
MSSFKHPTYTDEQLHRYLAHIKFPNPNVLPPPTLATLTALMIHHTSVAPFENISIHYTPSHSVILDPEHLYRKVVERNCGGYCMENSGMFAVVLRSLGFNIMTSGARVSNLISSGSKDGGYLGWSHMINIVTIDGQDYHVDVGFGSRCVRLAFSL